MDDTAVCRLSTINQFRLLYMYIYVQDSYVTGSLLKCYALSIIFEWPQNINSIFNFMSYHKRLYFKLNHIAMYFDWLTNKLSIFKKSYETSLETTFHQFVVYGSLIQSATFLLYVRFFALIWMPMAHFISELLMPNECVFW